MRPQLHIATAAALFAVAACLDEPGEDAICEPYDIWVGEPIGVPSIGYSVGEHLVSWVQGDWLSCSLRTAQVSTNGTVGETGEPAGGAEGYLDAGMFCRALRIAGPSGHLLVSTDRHAEQIVVMSLDAEGLPSGSWIEVGAFNAEMTSSPSVAAIFDGERFWIAWSHYPDRQQWEIRAVRMAPDLTLLDADPIEVASDSLSSLPDVAVAGSSGAAWIVWDSMLHEDPAGAATPFVVEGARVAVDGTVVDSPPVRLFVDAYDPRLAALGDQILVVADSSFPDSLNARRLGAAGPLSDASRYAGVVHDDVVDLVAVDDLWGYALLLHSHGEGPWDSPCETCQTIVAHLDAEGAPLTPTVLTAISGTKPAISFNGSGFLLASVNERAVGEDGSEELVVRTLDLDGAAGETSSLVTTEVWLEHHDCD